MSEDLAAQGSAVELCHRLLTRFGKQLTFHVGRVSFSELDDPDSARRATEAAAWADIILIAAHFWHLPPKVLEWLQSCAKVRTMDQGALALLITHSPGMAAHAEDLWIGCREAARKLRMDYLPLAPTVSDPSNGTAANESSPSVPLLGEHRSRFDAGYTHWGLNE